MAGSSCCAGGIESACLSCGVGLVGRLAMVMNEESESLGKTESTAGVECGSLPSRYVPFMRIK